MELQTRGISVIVHITAVIFAPAFFTIVFIIVATAIIKIHQFPAVFTHGPPFATLFTQRVVIITVVWNGITAALSAQIRVIFGAISTPVFFAPISLYSGDIFVFYIAITVFAIAKVHICAVLTIVIPLFIDCVVFR